MVPSAYVRVFERLTDHVGGPQADAHARNLHPSAQEALSRVHATASGPWVDPAESVRVDAAMILGVEPADTGDMRLFEHDGELYACPTQLRDRTRAATVELARQLPTDVTAAMLPGSKVSSLSPGKPRVNTHQSAWAIPLAWALMFDPIEHAGQGNVLVAPLDEALANVGYAIRMIDAHDPGREDLLVELAELDLWLATFGDTGLVELDARALSSVRPARRSPLRAPQHPRRMCANLTEYLELLAQGNTRRAERKIRTVEKSYWRARMRAHTS